MWHLIALTVSLVMVVIAQEYDIYQLHRAEKVRKAIRDYEDADRCYAIRSKACAAECLRQLMARPDADEILRDLETAIRSAR
jgi:hypothetical protein